MRDPDPVLFFENKKCYKLITGEVPDDDYIVPIGKANVLREGDDITVISYSLPLHFVEQAAQELAEEGISAIFWICVRCSRWIKRVFWSCSQDGQSTYHS